MPSEPSATIPTPPLSDSKETQALINQIAAEARASGKSVVFDPDAPADDVDAAPAAPAKGTKGTAAPAASSEGEGDTDTESETSTDETAEAADPDAEEADAEEADAEDAAQDGQINVEAITAALGAEGGVDMLALAKALGKEPEDLGVTPGAAKFLRLEGKKAQATLQRAHDLAHRLQRDYGDQVKAREAVAKGELEPAIEFIQKTFGLEWNELNKAVGSLLQGKPVPGLEEKRKLRELERREAERAEQIKADTAKAEQTAKVEQAKTWIKQQIKADKLAAPELEKQLKEAGFPSVVDLVFEEMQANYSKGLTDPKKALENVRAKLTRQAKALRSAGLVPKGPPPPKGAPVSASKPRANAQTGMAGNGRPMTDAELRQAVLKEAGLWR